MKQIHFAKLAERLGAAVVGTAMLASCIDGYDAEPDYATDVRNSKLEAPEMTWAKNADGTQTVISWPVVHGAEAYRFTVTNVTDEANPVVVAKDTLIDGIQFSIPRAEDQYYQVIATTVGDTRFGNSDSDAETVTVSTFTPSLLDTPIPSGSDLTEVINSLMKSELPEEEFGIDLEPGGTFTMSGKVDLGDNVLTIRSTNPNNPATITPADSAGFETYGGVTFKNLIFECAGMTNKNSSILAYSSTPSEDIYNTDHYLIHQNRPTVFQNCRVKGLVTRMIFDNCKPYAIETILIKNCVIEVDQVAQSSKKSSLGGTSAVCVVDLSNAFCYNLSILQSTIYSTTSVETTTPSIVQFEGKRSQQICNGLYTSNYINVENNTFVNCTKSTEESNGLMFSWTRFRGQSNTYAVNKNNIFQDCSGRRVKRSSFLQGQNSNMSATFENNCYIYNGLLGESWNTFPKPDEVSADPELTQDPTTGIFKVATEVVKLAKCGDPRGLE